MIVFFESDKSGIAQKNKGEFYPKSKVFFDNKTRNQISSDAKLIVNNRLVRLENDDEITIDNNTYKVIAIDLAIVEAFTNYWLRKQNRDARQY